MEGDESKKNFQAKGATSIFDAFETEVLQYKFELRLFDVVVRKIIY